MDQDTPRTSEQNAKFHAMCRDIARQLEWAGRRWSEEDWKRILLAAKFGQDIVPNPLGYSVIVVNKKRIRDARLNDLTELIGEVEAFGVENGVQWSEDESE